MFGQEMLNPGRLEALGKGPTADCLWQAGVLSGWKSFALLRKSSSVSLSPPAQSTAKMRTNNNGHNCSRTK